MDTVKSFMRGETPMKTGDMKKEQLLKEREKRLKQIARLKQSAAGYKNALALLQQERDTARQYLDFAGVIIVVIDSAQKVVLINNRGAEILGYRRKDIIGKNWFDTFVPERMRDSVKKVFTRLITGKIKSGEYYENAVLTKNGGEKIIAWHNSLLKDKTGRVYATLSSGDDVTERKQMYDTLKGNEERFRTIVENIDVGIYRIGIYKNKDGPYGRLIQANQALAQMLGYTSVNEFLKASILDHYQDPEERKRFIKDLLSSGSVKDRELHLLKCNGASLWAAITGNAQYDESGTIKWIDGIIEDISDRKMMEEELRALSLIDELTDLYNRRGFLTLAEQQLRIADRSKRQQSLLFADLDNLKWINDTLGHKEGDQALIDTAHILRETFRKSDIIARIGGDEFVLLAIDTPSTYTKLLSSRLQQAVHAHNQAANRPFTLSISLGITHYHPGQSRSVDELIAEADELMYQQKAQKQNRGKGK